MREAIGIFPRTTGSEAVKRLNMDYKIEEVALSLKFVMEILKISEADQEIPVCFRDQKGKTVFGYQIGFSHYITDSIKNIEMAYETCCDYLKKIRKCQYQEPELIIIEKPQKDSSIFEETTLNEILIIHSNRSVMLEGMIDIIDKNILKIPKLASLGNMDLYLTKKDFIGHVQLKLVTSQMMLAKNNLKLEIKKNCRNV